jgi:hypothetical protein
MSGGPAGFGRRAIYLDACKGVVRLQKGRLFCCLSALRPSQPFVFFLPRVVVQALTKTEEPQRAQRNCASLSRNQNQRKATTDHTDCTDKKADKNGGMSPAWNPSLLLIRVISEIRGSLSLFAAQKQQPHMPIKSGRITGRNGSCAAIRLACGRKFVVFTLATAGFPIF